MNTFAKLAALSALLVSSATVAFACPISASRTSASAFDSIPTAGASFTSLPSFTQSFSSPIAPSGISAALVHCFDGPGCGSVTIPPTAVNLVSGLDVTTFSFIPVLNSSQTSSSRNIFGAAATSIAPEPGSLFLLGTGLLAGPALLLMRRRSIV